MNPLLSLIDSMLDAARTDVCSLRNTFVFWFANSRRRARARNPQFISTGATVASFIRKDKQMCVLYRTDTRITTRV